MSHISALCHRIAQARWFENLTVGVIILNAIVLGLETYPTLARDYGEVLQTANGAFLAYFTVEITIRIVAYGRRPWVFFRSGWNVFDFVVISAAYYPACARMPLSSGCCGSSDCLPSCPTCGYSWRAWYAPSGR